jgi:hypothetical protein
LSEQDLLAAADSVEEKKRPEQQCEAWYYVGLKRLLNGDRAGALKLFGKQSPPAKRPPTSTILLKRN